MAELKPHLDELKKKHGSDKQAFAKAQMDLYKEHGVNPAGGCLPTLIQLPVLIALYQSIFAFFSGSAGLQRINNLLYFPAWHLDKAPQASFLGFNLAHKPSEFASAGIFLLAIPAVTAALTFAQSKMMSPTPVKTYQSDSPKEKKEKAQSEDTMVAVQSQMTYLMPLMIGYFAFQFPIGLALYWNT
ncbi:membrane protein insertase YidC, partial [Candidatus Daviesbacteria bacterium]|nr:membrane protein insertase YidC [Candidatus Daviesbacteria bacterium]